MQSVGPRQTTRCITFRHHRESVLYRCPLSNLFYTVVQGKKVNLFTGLVVHKENRHTKLGQRALCVRREHQGHRFRHCTRRRDEVPQSSFTAIATGLVSTVRQHPIRLVTEVDICVLSRNSRRSVHIHHSSTKVKERWVLYRHRPHLAPLQVKPSNRFVRRVVQRLHHILTHRKPNRSLVMEGPTRQHIHQTTAGVVSNHHLGRCHAVLFPRETSTRRRGAHSSTPSHSYRLPLRHRSLLHHTLHFAFT